MPHDWDHLHAACAEAAVCQSCGGMLKRSKIVCMLPRFPMLISAWVLQSADAKGSP